MFIQRLWNRFAAPFQLLYWRMSLSHAEGAKLLIEHDGKLLMIRETYGPQHWTFPGGRLKKEEAPTDTARRKAMEEVGITLTNPHYLGSYFHTRQYKKDAICVYYEKVTSSSCTPNDSTVAEAGWFTPEEITHLTHSDSVDDALELFRRHTGRSNALPRT